MLDLDKLGKLTKPILPTVYEDAYSYIEEVAILRDATREVAKQSNENKENLNKKVSYDDMRNKYKMSDNADFRGSWFGFKNPVASEPGIQNQVTKNINDIIEIKKQIENEAISVNSFGAIGDYFMEDGSINPNPTDNYLFIQEALNISKSIRLGKGSYYCSQRLKLPKNCTIMGNYCSIVFENDGLEIGNESWNQPKFYDLKLQTINGIRTDLTRVGKGIFSEDGYIVYPVLSNVHIVGFKNGIKSTVKTDASNFTWGIINDLKIEYCDTPIYFKDGWMNAIEMGNVILNFNDYDGIVFDTCNQIHSMTIEKLVLESNCVNENYNGSPVLFNNCSNGQIAINSLYIENNGYSKVATLDEIVMFKQGDKVEGKFYDSKTWEIANKWYSDDTRRITNKNLGGSGIFRFNNCLSNLNVSLNNIFIATNLLPLISYTNSPMRTQVNKVHLVNAGFSFPNTREFFTNTTPSINVIVDAKYLTNEGGGTNINYGGVSVRGDLFSNPTESQFTVLKTKDNVSLPNNIDVAIPWTSREGLSPNILLQGSDNTTMVINENGMYMFSSSFVFERSSAEGLKITIQSSATNKINNDIASVTIGECYSTTGMLYLKKGDTVRIFIKNRSETANGLVGYLNNINFLNIQKLTK